VSAIVPIREIDMTFLVVQEMASSQSRKFKYSFVYDRDKSQ